MPSALRSIIHHVWTFAKIAVDGTTSIDTFSEFQLRDIGLTRDNDSIRARAGDIAVPWLPVADPEPVNAPLPLVADNGVASVQTTCPDAGQQRATSLRRRPKTENKDINISLCD